MMIVWLFLGLALAQPPANTPVVNELYFQNDTLVYVNSFTAASCTPQPRVGDKQIVCTTGASYLPPDLGFYTNTGTATGEASCSGSGPAFWKDYRAETCISVDGEHFKSACSADFKVFKLQTFSDAGCTQVLTSISRTAACVVNATANSGTIYGCGAFATEVPTTTSTTTVLLTLPPTGNPGGGGAFRVGPVWVVVVGVVALMVGL